jgi:hypothetical protein
MILISHRGNLTGPNPFKENSLQYIQEALDQGFDVEIDVWIVNEILYLGHDDIQYKVSLDWLVDKIKRLWIHCKNMDALVYFNTLNHPFNYFWHEEDKATLTSQHHIWAYPGYQPIINSIAVMPERNNDNTDSCLGICSDYIQNYKQ